MRNIVNALLLRQGGQPNIIDDEHTELRWFTLEEAKALPDLALEDYRSLFDSLRLTGT